MRQQLQQSGESSEALEGAMARVKAEQDKSSQLQTGNSFFDETVFRMENRVSEPTFGCARLSSCIKAGMPVTVSEKNRKNIFLRFLWRISSEIDQSSKTHMRLKWAVSSLSEGFPGCLDAPNRFAKISNPLTVTGIPALKSTLDDCWAWMEWENSSKATNAMTFAVLWSPVKLLCGLRVPSIMLLDWPAGAVRLQLTEFDFGTLTVVSRFTSI